MDYQFFAQGGQISAKCSMGHEALANWLNTEVRSNSQLISTALSLINQARQAPMQDFKLLGAEYSIFISADEVMVRANNLSIDEQQELEQDFHYYDEESLAFCGLEDFEQFLQSYLSFNR
ncbi:YacL family protein [Avibacterium avium]|uniref:UPF0231 family protein n=1 Tax=Avibacterium avium TaxID=751 RepID=UPI003BF78905